MKFILSYIAVALLAFTKDLKTASADNIRHHPVMEEPSLTDSLGRDTILMNDKPAQRKLKHKGKAKGGKAKGGGGSGDEVDVCKEVFLKLAADGVHITEVDLSVAFADMGVWLEGDEVDTMMILLDSDDDDVVIDLEEFRPNCLFARVQIPGVPDSSADEGQLRLKLRRIGRRLKAALDVGREFDLNPGFVYPIVIHLFQMNVLKCLIRA